MKHAILSGLLAAVFSCAHGQAVKSKYDMYERALDKFVEEIETYHAAAKYRNALDTVYLFLNENFPVPSMVRGRRVVKLTQGNIDSVYAWNANKIVQINVSSLRIHSDTATIEYLFVGTEKKGSGPNSVQPTPLAWTTIKFKLNCASGNWEYVKTASRSL